MPEPARAACVWRESNVVGQLMYIRTERGMPKSARTASVTVLPSGAELATNPRIGWSASVALAGRRTVVCGA